MTKSKFLKSVFIVAFAGFMQSCKTLSVKPSLSEILTQETSSALASACKTVVSGDEVHDAFDQRNRLCRCLGEQSGPRISRDLSDKACSGRGDLKKWEEFIVGKFKKRWPKDFLAKSPVENAACLQSLTFLNLELFYFELENICKRSDVDKLDEFIVFPKASPKQDGCWELVGMTADGCFEAESCPGTTADLKYLPLSPPREGLATGVVKLCNQAIQKIHKVKDPSNANLLYNQPFAIELSANRSSNHITYTAANCHGVAQAVIGGPLGAVEMKEIKYRVLADEAQCGPLARAKLLSKSPPTVDNLALDPGGLLINMNHSFSCSSTDCGSASLYVDDCKDKKLHASTFIDKMCVNCWAKSIEDAGLKPLDSKSTAKDLQPGCLLTQADHSVVVVLQNDHFCYFYEATSPFGPPQLRTKPCAVLWSGFERKWCPEKRMMFEGIESK